MTMRWGRTPIDRGFFVNLALAIPFGIFSGDLTFDLLRLATGGQPSQSSMLRNALVSAVLLAAVVFVDRWRRAGERSASAS
jgi:hypothetical protein